MEASTVSVGSSPERAVRGEGLVGDKSPSPDGCENPAGPNVGINYTVTVSRTHTHTHTVGLTW